MGRNRRAPSPPQAPSSRQQLMRQQFYTNNERRQMPTESSIFWADPSQRNLHPPTTSSTTTTTATRLRHVTSARYQLDLLNGPSPSAQTSTEINRDNNHRLTQPVISSSRRPTTNSTSSPLWAGPDDDTAAANSLATAAATQLPKECLQQYNPAYHSASPSMPSSGTGTVTGPCAGGAGVAAGAGVGGDSTGANLLADCIGSGDCVNSTGLPGDCSDQFALMNIRTEELNFADTEQVWLVKSWPEILARVSCVAPIVLLGLIGNLTIIYSMYRFKPIRSKPTNIFILNMACADLLTTIVCPNAALLTDIYQFYVMGAFVCRTEGFIKITCLLVSAYSLIVLSSDWFLSVVKPCRTRITIKQSWLTLAGIWLVSVSMASPLLYWRRLRERHWNDLTEIWCCELIQYTKYYWVCITLFLIYLPTFIMTIVLVVILARMDRFEAKLRRSRAAGAQAGLARPSTSSLTGGGMSSPTASGMAGVGSTGSSFVATNQANHHNQLSAPSNSTRISITTTPSQNHTTQANNNKWLPTTSSGSGGGWSASRAERQLNSSLTLGMKYRRRIVKILFFYLLTSIVCWTPLQFTIIYRHFRSDPVPAGWFFELTFYSQLSASLSGAMNPIIFGFLSQPFRRVVTKSWMFRFLDKIWRSRSDAGGGGGGDQLRPPANVMINLATPVPRNGPTARQVAAVERERKFNIDYVEHNRSHRQLAAAGQSSKQSELDSRRTPTGGRSNQARPLSANLTTNTKSHNNHYLQKATAVKRSRSTAVQTSGASSTRHKRVSFNSKTSGGLDNAAYTKTNDDEEECAQSSDKTTSFIVAQAPTTNQNETRHGREAPGV